MRNRKTYYQVTSLVFLIVAVLHAMRLLYGWEAVVAGVTVPLWVSWAAVLIAGYLSYRGFTWKQLK
ncbi:MAG: hypothetical protein KBD05_03345 [Candidatus Pacebacteria bacterium]|nr:hypothetical protein [Candidatus Paceibacterota bacterium]